MAPWVIFFHEELLRILPYLRLSFPGGNASYPYWRSNLEQMLWSLIMTNRKRLVFKKVFSSVFTFLLGTYVGSRLPTPSVTNHCCFIHQLCGCVLMKFWKLNASDHEAVNIGKPKQVIKERRCLFVAFLATQDRVESKTFFKR